jgi:hypothetical protein
MSIGHGRHASTRTHAILMLLKWLSEAGDCCRFDELRSVEAASSWETKCAYWQEES